MSAREKEREKKKRDGEEDVSELTISIGINDKNVVACRACLATRDDAGRSATIVGSMEGQAKRRRRYMCSNYVLLLPLISLSFYTLVPKTPAEASLQIFASNRERMKEKNSKSVIEKLAKKYSSSFKFCAPASA